MKDRCRYCTPDLALTACKVGECFLVQVVDGEGAERLRDLGVREGALVNMLRNSGDVVVQVEGCRVGLRREIAGKVLGTQIQK